MSKYVELDEDEAAKRDTQAALREAEARAAHAEAELAKLKAAMALHDAVDGDPHEGSAGKQARGKAGRSEDEAGESRREAHTASHQGRKQPAAEQEGDLFAGAEEPEAEPRRVEGNEAKEGTEQETPARRAQRLVGQEIERERHEGGPASDRHGRVDPKHDPGNASEIKEPPTRSSAEGEPEMAGGEEELRNDSMMAHLLDSLEAGKDIGHYGRLVFSMVARHFLPHEEVIGWLTKDHDFGEEEAQLMLRQVEGRDYSPPRRAKILEYQREQEFPILPHPHDPDCGNLYRNLKFPDAVYQHIGHYQEQKMEAEDE